MCLMIRARAGLVLAYFLDSLKPDDTQDHSTTSHHSLVYISARVLLQSTSLIVLQMYCAGAIVALSGGTSTFGAV